ncbi:SMC-Scp complex subunit ScpB [Carnobacteriaceae bacterium zg-ZUI252]|nr:SMC-Scp complex subunit ScpB [Carnobacteriaceae bacterium zg-ZUI252]MBS4770698.1 SMC-Scp complex subunit ScpB [Carnobacteriaceae bacterium zg-ZUI240]QTU82711.1 SMC-Scp complex subunit ScpB [Carnobacteriaceae bacterium zg-C25]
MTLQATIESLLFVSGDEGLSLGDLELLLKHPQEELKEAIQALHDRYLNDANSGLALVSFAHRYQLVTKGVYADVVKQYAQAPFATKLSQASLETLAIVAYKQPITRAEIDQIRGVQSSATLQKLQLRDLVQPVGRQDTPGKPILYGTTEYFMNYFGVTDMSQLPDLSTFTVADDEELMDLFSQRYTQASSKETEEN